MNTESNPRNECTLSDEELLNLMRPKGSSLEYGLVDLCQKLLDPSMDMVEVGSFVGSSARIFSPHVRSILCVDTWNTYFEDPSLNQNLEALFDKNMEGVQNYSKIKGKSIEIAKFLMRAPTGKGHTKIFDFIYIDAGHSFENISADILAWTPLLKSDGILAGHDIQWPGVKQAVSSLIGPVRLFADDSWVRINPKNLYEE